LALAALGLLAALAAGPLIYFAMRRMAALPPPYPPPRSVSLGPVTVLSGLIATGPCGTFGLTADKWRCEDPAYAIRTDHPPAYRLWVILADRRAGPRAFDLLNIPLDAQPHGYPAQGP
jgi:hypothetical protein